MEPGKCTHKSTNIGDKQKVEMCKSLKKASCKQDDECVLNYEEMPSEAPGICTHRYDHRGNKDQV